METASSHGTIYGVPTVASGPGLITEKQTDAAISLLRKNLLEEHEKVLSLTSQLATNAQVVQAFEQSLANMTQRLQHITLTAEQKDSELSELRYTIEKLRQSGADAGLLSSQVGSLACK